MGFSGKNDGQGNEQSHVNWVNAGDTGSRVQDAGLGAQDFGCGVLRVLGFVGCRVSGFRSYGLGDAVC